MDFPLHTAFTAPVRSAPQVQQGVVDISQDPQNQAKIQPTPTIPAELGVVASVNASRISGQKPTIPEIMATERVLKPYGVTMLPSNETGEKVTQHKA